MKRMVLVLSVAVMMVGMMLALAAPAFAVPPPAIDANFDPDYPASYSSVKECHEQSMVPNTCRPVTGLILIP